eukprot:gene6234-8589_t
MVSVTINQPLNFNKTLPIVFVYTVVPAVCKHGLPKYIKESVEQAIVTQSKPDSQVMMVSNFASCPEIEQTLHNIPHNDLLRIDASLITSNRTSTFANLSKNIFESDYGNELWLTSALRFFIMEDVMIQYDMREIIHVEADNLLYKPMTYLLEVLRSGYKGLAATPLNANKSFITASVLWIASLSALQEFNNYLLDMAYGNDNKNGKNTWKSYLHWLRKYACCKPGGIDPDEKGNGIKPFAVNEMSMLAYYHYIKPNSFQLFPVVPSYDYPRNRHLCNMSAFSPHGHEVGPATLDGIWDPNSWGQFIGGTATKKGRDKGFTDSTHISGQAIRTANCIVQMLCGNQTEVSINNRNRLNVSVSKVHDNNHSSITNDNSIISDHNHDVLAHDHVQGSSSNSSLIGKCFTAPYVRCGDDGSAWTPLWNLHVHSKHTLNYRSAPCLCP